MSLSPHPRLLRTPKTSLALLFFPPLMQAACWTAVLMGPGRARQHTQPGRTVVAKQTRPQEITDHRKDCSSPDGQELQPGSPSHFVTLPTVSVKKQPGALKAPSEQTISPGRVTPRGSETKPGL